MFYRFSPSVFPLFFCNRDPFPLSLQNVLPFQFRHSAEDRQHKLSGWGASINGFLLGNELNPFGCQLFYQFKQVFGVPGKAADRLYNDHITLPDKLQHRFQLRTVGVFSAGFIDIDLIDTQLFHENFLAHRVLLLGADADISYFHGMAPFSCLFQIILVY